MRQIEIINAKERIFKDLEEYADGQTLYAKLYLGVSKRDPGEEKGHFQKKYTRHCEERQRAIAKAAQDAKNDEEDEDEDEQGN